MCRRTQRDNAHANTHEDSVFEQKSMITRILRQNYIEALSEGSFKVASACFNSSLNSVAKAAAGIDDIE